MSRRKKRKTQSTRRKLRKQPKTRRMSVQGLASIMPAIRSKPKPSRSVRQRRATRRKRRFQAPILAIRRFIFSARWISLGMLLLSGLALYFIGVDTRYRLTNVPVAGAQMLPANEILHASGLSGLHIFAADPNQVANQINQLPGVISATVTLEWPNQASIRIKEDTPVAQWQQNDGLYWVNKNGQLVEAIQDIPNIIHIQAEYLPEELPLPGEENKPVVDGEEEGDLPAEIMHPTQFVSPEILDGALQLYELYPELQKLYYRPSGGLSFDDPRGWRAYFGTGKDMQQKKVIYETLIENLQTQNISVDYLSVSNKENPFYSAHN